MENKELTISGGVMRENCIEIHQQVFELYKVADHIGEDLELEVKSANDLLGKTWPAMGRFAKELHDNSELWDKLPESMRVQIDVAYTGQSTQWVKEEARKRLLDCYFELGGKRLYSTKND